MSGKSYFLKLNSLIIPLFCALGWAQEGAESHIPCKNIFELPEACVEEVMLKSRLVSEFIKDFRGEVTVRVQFDSTKKIVAVDTLLVNVRNRIVLPEIKAALLLWRIFSLPENELPLCVTFVISSKARERAERNDVNVPFCITMTVLSFVGIILSSIALGLNN